MIGSGAADDFQEPDLRSESNKQRLRAGMVPHHKQQASECDGEQQHRELWPAYNPNIALPQAPTEGLFQQILPIALIEGFECNGLIFAS
jgi:hypothetical protein